MNRWGAGLARGIRSTATTPLGRRVALAALLAFGVVGFQHVLHAVVSGPPDSLSGHLSHWLRDGMLAFGLALLAVEAGLRLSARPTRRSGRITRDGSPTRLSPAAAAVSLAFAALSVPSVLAHGALDGDGHAAGGTAAVDALEHAGTLAGSLLHGLRDALVGQVAALPLVALGLVLFGFAARPAGLSGWSRRRCVARLRPAAALLTVISVSGGMLVATPSAVRPVRAAASDPCSSGAPERVYDVSAINVRIQYNRFGDHDPGGSMYVLDQDIPAVRAQEASRQVSTGLRKDAIQPLVLRANLGECLVVRFSNRLTTGPEEDEGEGGPAPRVSFHVNGLAFQADSAGGAVGNNPDSFAAPGQSRTYRIAVDGREGGHAVHSGGDSRDVTSHGLFGAVIAEPAGSRYLDPETGAPTNGTNWESIIAPPSGVTFREFAILYHEVGNEHFDLRDAAGEKLPTVDPLTGAYRPGARALNYRSEPHMRRVELGSDGSQAYGSYTFGDPATPIPRSYLGEPTKTRLVHAGGEMAHVHHLHGGGDRWRRNPGADDTDIAGGLRKQVPAAKSIRLDSQIIEPGEAYSLEHECGAGGCQQAAGDFLFHCHIAHHYVGGMFSFWRVFDTRQPDLATLPDRAVAPTAVRSDGLIGRVIEGKTVVPAAQLTNPATQRSLEELVESQLPPPGVRLDDQDATVWDWVKQGTPNAPVYLGEPEDTRVWANFASPTPGQRPVILFNPTNGRYTWPLLRPHLAQRPPFSPNGHSGAPWLGETGSPTRPDGLCPQSSFVRRYDITAITLPIQETDKGREDPDGQIFVLNEDKAAVLSGAKPAGPLAIRSNAGELGGPFGDCVALTLTSQLVDNDENEFFSKVNMHTHFVQFDPQASDGVITGFSFEQSVRPFPTENRRLAEAAAAGATQVRVTSTDRLRAGIFFAVGQGEATIEIRRITALNLATGLLTLDRPLDRAHPAGEAAGVEFVQYRWFSDVDTGTVFWHDHVRGTTSWDHGLFGAQIIEPPGSTYHDPRTGAEVRSGAIVDIRTNGSVGAGQQGSFREMVAWLHNDLRAHGNDGDGRGSINLRAEPLEDRDGNTDPFAFSSVRHGDPFTPLPRAYAGDPFVFRVVGLVEKEGSLRVLGHRFREERFDARGDLEDSMTTGISERGDLVLDGGAGGPARKPGDYLYYSTTQREFEDGAWGILRVHDTRQPDLQRLPGRPAPPTGAGFPRLTTTEGPPPPAAGPGQPCPAGAPLRRYDVTIFRQPLPLAPNQDSAGVVYALSEDEAAILAGTKPVEPLAIRAAAGECVEITLANHLDRRASLALGEVLLDPQGSAGSAVGFNPDSTVAPGASFTYRVFADRELGTLPFLNLGDVSTLVHGAFGALVVEPAGASWTDPATGAPIRAGVLADVHTPAGDFRELVALFHDADQQIGRSVMPYNRNVEDFAGLNYRAAPFEPRRQANPDPSLVFSSTVHGDPPTTLLRAYVGDPVRLRVAAPAAEQFHGFAVEGHHWPLEPDIPGSELLSERTLGPGQNIDAILDGGAGGTIGAPGDYLYLDHRFPFTQAGLWGIFRVHANEQPDLRPLGPATPPPPPPGARLVVTPTSLDFGSRFVGKQSRTRFVTVENRGTADARITSLSLTGPNADSFNLDTRKTTCSGVALGPNGSCRIGVRFKPTQAGSLSATLQIDSDAPDSPHPVALSGTGRARKSAGPVTLVDLGKVKVGTSRLPRG